MPDTLLISNLRRTQAFDRNLRANAGIEKIATDFVDAIMFQPDGVRRTDTINSLKLDLFQHAKNVALPQAEKIGTDNARGVMKAIPNSPNVARPEDLRKILFGAKTRDEQRLRIIKSAIDDSGSRLDARLVRHWLEPAEGGAKEKLARLREIHNRLEVRRKNYEEKYRSYVEGAVKQRPSKPALDFMSELTSDVKQNVRVQARRAGTDAETRVFTASGYNEFAWVAVNAGEACPDCALRQAVILTIEQWERVGRPGSGETICGDSCFCMLVPAETLTVSSSLSTPSMIKGNPGVLTTASQRALFDANRGRKARAAAIVSIPKKPGAASTPEAIPEVKAENLLQPLSDKETLVRQARDTKPLFDALANEGKGVQRDIGARSFSNIEDALKSFSKPGPVVITAPIKSDASIESKVKKFGGDYSKVTDVVRGTVAVDKASDMGAVMESIKDNARASGFKIAAVTNRVASPTESGYRDLNVRLVAPNGHVVELQVNTKPMVLAKERGHKIYESAREIDRQAIAEKRSLTPAEAKRIEDLNKKAGKIYAKAWKDSGGTLLPAKVDPPPSPKAIAQRAMSGAGDGPAARPPDAGRKIEPPKSVEDMPRFIGEVERTAEYREAVNRLAAFRDEVSDGDIRKWSLEKHSVGGKLTAEREALHDRLVARVVTPESIAAPGERPKAALLLGPPGAGKTTAGAPQTDKLGVKFAVINADDVKAALPEYRGWNAALVHEESSLVAEGKMFKKALEGNHNLLLDATGANAEKMIERVEELAKAGYDVHVINVELPAFKATGRSWNRFQGNAFNWSGGDEPGRFVPPKYSYEQVGNKPTKTYHSLKNNPSVKSWVSVDNDVNRGESPRIVDQGERE